MAGRNQKERTGISGFAKELLDYKAKHDLTMEELAVRAGIKYMTLYRWLEGGHPTPGNEYMIRDKLGLKKM